MKQPFVYYTTALQQNPLSIKALVLVRLARLHAYRKFSRMKQDGQIVSFTTPYCAFDIKTGLWDIYSTVVPVIPAERVSVNFMITENGIENVSA